ncbi:MAG TPA: dioxygenase [Streptosporangiaceae bacterium]|nr:dioxygenase [Streptosporangiaceae bacterium]
MITGPDDVTAAVLAEVERANDPRTKELLAAGVRHLHAFVRETQLTEAEFQQITRIIARLGQLTTESHNEVVLIAGSLGLSSLVCLQNNGASGEHETTANLMGPFWRAGSPREENGASVVRSPTPGDPIFVSGTVVDRDGSPVPEAEVEVWNTSADGLYENQDPRQADMNLRGRFVTDQNGRFSFQSVKPSGYPIPVNGPVGDLLRAQGRHNLRPAHIHFLISKPGYKTQFSQVYSSDDPNLLTDAQFGVTAALVGHYVRHDAAADPAPDPGVTGPWYSLDHRFVVEPGDNARPEPPISGKATEPAPQQEVLERTP